MLYFSYKHYTPEIGGAGDSVYYIQMILQPFNSDAAGSPYVYRQFSTFITSIILNTGVFYDSVVAYTSIESEKRIFFSFLLSNYIALLLTALIVSRVVDLEIGEKTVAIPILAGLICFMSFGASAYVLTMLIEGWTWFFIALGFYALKQKNVTLFIIAIIFGFIQKEMVSIFLGLMCFFLLIFDKNEADKTVDKKLFLMFAISLFSFLLYIIMRGFVIPVEGYESQINVLLFVENIIEFEYTNTSWIVSNFVNQNILYVFIFLFFLVYTGKRNTDELKLNYFYALIFSYTALFFISVAAGLKGDIAHILFISTPILSIYSAYYIYILDRR
jgi:hypothetical protein